MFEHLRAKLQSSGAAAQAVVAAAEERLTSAQANVVMLEGRVAGAQAALAAAQEALATAQASVDAAEAGLNQARTGHDGAAQRLEEWLNREPTNPLPTGKPNPQWPPWNTERERRDAALANATAAIPPAEATLGTAQSARGRAATDVATAEAGVNAEAAGAAEAQARANEARGAVDNARSVVDQLQSELAALDARTGRILADPLDRPGLELVADDALAAAMSSRRTRRQQWAGRLSLVEDRATTLGQHDATADDLASLAASIREWPDAHAFPELTTAAEAIDAVVAESRVQRVRAQRSDDLRAGASTLAGAVQQLQGASGAAALQRDAKARALDDAALALRSINDEAPKR